MMSETSGDTVVDGMVKKLESEFSPAKLEVIPAYGDPNGSHVTITVVSKVFEGKRAVQRQQLVYKVPFFHQPALVGKSNILRKQGARSRE